METMYVVMVQYTDDPFNVTPEMIFREKWRAIDYRIARRNQFCEDGYIVVDEIGDDDVIDDMNDIYIWVEEVEVR